MSVHTLEGLADGHREAACMVDSVTGTAFGPLFASADEIDSFLLFCRTNEPDRSCTRLADYGVRDVRALDDADLRSLHTRWLGRQRCRGGGCLNESTLVSPDGDPWCAGCAVEYETDGGRP